MNTCVLSNAQFDRLTKAQKAIMAIGAILLVMMAVMTVALASSVSSSASAIQDGVKAGSAQLYGILKAIVVPLGVVVLAWNGLKALFGGERGMEQAKRNILVIVIVMVVVFFAPLIVQQISSWFSSADNGGVFS